MIRANSIWRSYDSIARRYDDIWGDHFEDERNVSTALTEAGFADVQLHVVELKWHLSLEDYLADREITSSGRYAKYILGPDSWAQLLANAREKLRQQFGSCFTYSNGAIIALGHKK